MLSGFQLMGCVHVLFSLALIILKKNLNDFYFIF